MTAIPKHPLREYSAHFPCTIVRSAAIYSDWCEYSPLNALLSTWLSGNWNCNILAGRGEAAIPYLHINDMIGFLLKVIGNSGRLAQCDVLIASPNDCTSQKDLFEIAASYNYFHSIRPLFLPKWIAYVGVMLRDLWGRARGKRPFERPWMLKYVDRKMRVDASRTQELLAWKPNPRLHVKRRLLFLVANMKRNPYQWSEKNRDAYHAFIAESQSLMIYEAMVRSKNSIIQDAIRTLTAPENAERFPTYQQLEGGKLVDRIESVYDMMEADIRTGDRMNVLAYAEQLAAERSREGFAAEEVVGAVRTAADAILASLLAQPKMSDLGQRIHEEIMMTMQMVIDKIEDTFQELQSQTGQHFVRAGRGEDSPEPRYSQ